MAAKKPKTNHKNILLQTPGFVLCLCFDSQLKIVNQNSSGMHVVTMGYRQQD